MFKSAKIKLTAWYVIIIMIITISFSSIVYVGISQITERALETHRVRVERYFSNFNEFKRIYRMAPSPYVEAILEIKHKTITILVIINILILAVSSALGYLLAGKTLKPIENNVNKQKRFISDAAHELKTPITAIKTELEVSQRDKKLTLKDSRNLISSTIEEIDKLHNFINKLLTQAKYQNFERTGNVEKVNIEKLLKNIVKKLYPIAKKRRISLILYTKPIFLIGIKDSFNELFSNLIENAIKYNKVDGKVKIISRKKNNFAIIEIKDTGIGVSEKDIPNIFDPFYRTDQSRTKNKTNGFGLGLAISREIVDKYNGKIEVYSKLEKGTGFIVKIPLIYEA